MELLDHTPLLDLSYVIELVEADGVIPRNQEVPPAALITPDSAWRLWFWETKFMLPVLVLSYPWLDWWHPDRNGEQLRGLLPIMKILLAEARQYSPHATIGLMMDYPCIPQKPFATEGELCRFKASLGAINAWYFHPCTAVLVVSTLPPDLAGYTNTRPHSQRGWCFFEKAASEAVKDGNMLWDLRGFDAATCTCLGDANFNQHDSDSLLGQLRRGRGPPVSPEALADALRSGVADGTLGFTATADLEIVTEQYRLGFIGTHERAYSSPGVVDIFGLGWDDASFRTALRSLIYLSKHCAFEGDQKSSYMDYGFRTGSDGIQREFAEAGKAMRQDNPKLWMWIYNGDRIDILRDMRL